MERLRKGLSIFAAAALLAPASGALAGRPVFHHHHRGDGDDDDKDHYSDRGAKPTKTTVGDLTLRSRSLLAKDGNTQVEVTTGPFDKSAPGNISHVHIRAVDPSGRDSDDDKDGKGGKELRFRREYNHLRDGGYFVSDPFPGLPHGQNLRIEAKAKGSVHRDEVEAKWLDVVRYRPDLVMQSMDAPAAALVHSTVLINAVVTERMGELGAHADCALLVNGNQVDVAGIWVDAGKSSTCLVGATFDTVGVFNLIVRVQDVSPGDYDYSNNALPATIEIRNPVIYHDASASEDTIVTQTTTDIFLNGATTPDSHTVATKTTTIQARSFLGGIPVAVNAIKSLTFKDQSGGQVLTDLAYSNVGLQDVSTAGTTFTSIGSFSDDDPVTGRNLLLQRSYDANHNTGMTTLNVTWNPTEVLFHSVTACRVIGQGCTPGDFTTNTATKGTLVQFGNDYSADVVLDDGTPYSAHPAMTLVATGSSTPVVVSNMCQTRILGRTQTKTCTNIQKLSEVLKQGEALLQPGQ